jgi:hypothetical protein
MKNLILCFLSLFLVNVCSAQDAPTINRQNLSRAAFVAQMAKVRKGMTQDQVIALLGQPDSIRGNFWLYGVSPKSECPTLGELMIRDKIVSRMWGGDGTPPPESVISEATLRELLEIFWSLSPVSDAIPLYPFDPLRKIKAVNALLPYGKERVLAAAREFFRIWGNMSEPNGVLMVLQLLFEVPDSPSAFPPMSDYPHYPPPPVDKTVAPRYPLVLWEDVPIVLWVNAHVVSFIYAERYRSFLALLEKEGRFRTTPLRPPSDPLGMLPRLMASKQWLFGKSYHSEWDESRKEERVPQPDEEKLGRQMVMLQLLSLVRSALPASSPYCVYLEKGRDSADPETLWRQTRAYFAKLPLRWNPTINDYQAD